MIIRLAVGILITLLVVTAIVLIVVFTKKDNNSMMAEATVVRASLSSNLSSTGLVANKSFSTDIPLAALTVEDVSTLDDITKNDYTVNLVTLLSEGSQGPILYRVSEVGKNLTGKTTKFYTDGDSVDIITLVPIYFDWEKAAEHYAIEVSLGTTEAENVKEYVLSLLLREGISDVDPSAFPNEFWREDTEAAVTVSSGKISDMILRELPHVEKIAFTLSNLVWDKGDVLVLDNTLFRVSYSEMYVSFSLSEYDIATIHARMQEGERVYASVGVNALSGRELLAEVIQIDNGKNVSGVSYFTLLARLIFANVTEDEDGKEIGDYTYYDEFLSDSTVTYLGVDLTDNVRPDELLQNYSVTVSAQKTVVEDTLIVPTKCIYYDDAKKPYVLSPGADGKEKRIYIKITMSTGTDAAVTAADGYVLNEGDILRYTADATLIGSLF